MQYAQLSSLRKKVLEEAAKLVPKYGFRDAGLVSYALEATKENEFSRDVGTLGDADFARMFPRGFPIALVEHIVVNSNNVTHRRLEECFNKAATLESVAKNSELYRTGQYKPPGVKNVVEEAMLTKFNCLMPYVKHWPEAVALEWNPVNVPFAIKNMAEFVDTTCYYAERMENLGAVIASGNVLLQSRLHCFDPNDSLNSKPNRGCHAAFKTDEERFWHSFSAAIPLSNGPHTREGSLSYEWYAKRTKVAAVLSLGMLSFIGEESCHHPETKAMLKCITDKLL
ncbi:putative dynein heavy chain [Trypanosoma grayi]|uniref:putative dynein heavy chain n=1 Tax=Trypanosoma grayi TaxID=71804 RepID=UPI0004F3F0C2|nr:putative dynein heavy chain [Trypanosoma grayi]KEG10037.1 putative dynein heavy chain [Trypanosoma grayi]